MPDISVSPASADGDRGEEGLVSREMRHSSISVRVWGRRKDFWERCWRTCYSVSV